MRSENGLRRLIPFPDVWENAAIASTCQVDLIVGDVTPSAAELPDGLSSRDRLYGFYRNALLTRYVGAGISRAEKQRAKELAVIGQCTLED